MNLRCILNSSAILLIFITEAVLATNEEIVTGEVKFKDRPNLLRSKQTGSHGNILRIGSQTSRIILKDANYRCSREPESSPVRPHIHKITMVHEEGREPQPLIVSNYFIYAMSEIWKCEAIPGDAQSIFYRVVNELMSIIEISNIKYYDGIDVASVNYLGNGWRAKVKEIRYMLQEGDDYFTLNYTGKLTLFHEDNAQHNENPNSIKSNQEKYGIQIKEVQFSNDGEEAKKADIDSDGRTLKLGASWVKNRTQQLTNYKCEKYLGLHPLPGGFQPEVYEQIVDSQDPDIIIYARITDSKFSDLFTLTRSEVWLCTSEESVNQNLKFYRIVNEMIGRCRIKRVEYGDGISALSKLQIAAGLSIRFTDVGIFNIITGERLHKEIAYELVPGTPENSHIVLGGVTKIDVEYKLPSTSVYRILMSSSGYDIIVGTKVRSTTDTIGNEGTEAVCVSIDYDSNLMTNVDMKVDDGVSIYYKKPIYHNNRHYYKHITGLSWKCSVNALSFNRVVNVINIIAPVRSIEAFDGIQIEKKTFENGFNEIQITETKYVARNNFKTPIKFLGTITFEVPRNEDREDSNQEIISEEETTYLQGFADSNNYLKDFTSNEYQEIRISNEENNMKFVIPSSTTTLGHESDVVECKRVNRERKLLPYFEIYKDSSTNIVEKMVDFEDNITQSSYFETDSYKLWLCQCPEKDYDFYRAVTKQTLKRETPHKIGRMECLKRDLVWSKMGYGNQFSVKMNSVRYYNSTNSRNTARHYEGYIAFEEAIPSGKWKSGTREVSSLTSNLRKRVKYESVKVVYDLTQARSASMLLGSSSRTTPHSRSGAASGRSTPAGSRGRSTPIRKSGSGSADSGQSRADSQRDGTIVIGSNTYHQILKGPTAICEMRSNYEESPRNGDERFLTKITKVLYSDNSEITGWTYFDFKILKIWNCTSSDGNKFLRVINHFKNSFKIENVAKIIYYDGVTVFWRQNTEELYEFREVRYFDMLGQSVIKFVGELQLKDPTETVNLQPVSLGDVEIFRRDNQNYYLRVNELFKTVVGDEGAIFEIGEAHEQVYNSPLKCDEIEKPPAEMQPALTPKIISITEKEGLFTRTFIKTKNHFNLQQRFWKCQSPNSELESIPIKFYRVQNVLNPEGNKKINVVYYHDGVIVYTKDNTTYIEEIKYFFERRPSAAIKMNGLVKLTTVKLSELTTTRNNGFRDFYYITTNERVGFKNFESKGIVLEVGLSSEYIKGSIGTLGKVECSRMNDDNYPDLWSSNVMEVSASGNQKMRMSPLANPHDFFITVERELWKCEMTNSIDNTVTIFYRVKNSYTSLMSIATIYYHDGVTISAITLKHGRTMYEIEQVKFLTNLTDVTFTKYGGELTLKNERDTVVERVFTENNQIVTDPASAKDGKLLNGQVKILMVLAVMRGKCTHYVVAKKLRDVETYSMRKFQTEILKKGHRVLQLGTYWEEELTNTNGDMKCHLYAEMGGGYYLPRVVELIGDKTYVLNWDEIFELFHKFKTEVWLCFNNKDRMIRIDSQWEGKGEAMSIFALRHTDTVQFEIIEEPNDKYIVRVNETIYYNHVNSKVVKYDGEISLMKLKEQDPSRKKKSRSFMDSIARVASKALKAVTCQGPAPHE
ncbi:uncharacterized protein LOC111064557 isoform X2 [Nilaparvata lugens]|uniref:uncharacterized protein LOC111064557 isoform X2 n=1 Tax=Nilaparvata lugens TaxID=108931 RepID=UPI00193DDEB1|nr:uncharacterized protein LOC111064557 isoform X2 [Nilaparvata lugens]